MVIAEAEAELQSPVVMVPESTKWRWIQSRWFPWILGAALYFLTGPQLVNKPGRDLDSFWIISLAMSVHHHLHWGSQVAWTYGPLGFLEFTTLLFRGQWILSVLAVMAVHALFIGSFLWFVARCDVRRIWWIPLGATLLLIGPIVTPLESQLALSTCFLGLVALLRPCTWRLASSVGALGAFGLLVKGTSAITCVCLIVIFALAGVFQRRRELLAAIPAAIVTFMGLWLISGQVVSELPSYLLNSIDLALSYSSALITADPEPLPMAGIIMAVAFASIAVSAILQIVMQKNWNIWPFGLVGLTALIYYKEGTVRLDSFHSFVAPCMMAVVLIGLVGIAAANGTRTSRRIAAGSLGIVAVYSVFVLTVAIGLPFDSTLGAGLAHVGRYPSALEYAISPEETAAFVIQNKAFIRERSLLPDEMLDTIGHHSIGFFPNGVGLAYAENLSFDPFPVFQSYAGATTRLDEIAAQHLLGPDAPDFILWANSPIDGRNLSYDEPAVTRALWSEYRTEAVSSTGWVLLRHDPATITPQVVGVFESGINNWVQVPATPPRSIMTASFTLKPTLLEQFQTFFVRGNPVWIDIEYQDGTVTRSRVQPGNVVDGLLVSNVPRFPNEFAAFEKGQPSSAVSRFRIVLPDGGHYQPEFSVTMTRYTMTPRR